MKIDKSKKELQRCVPDPPKTNQCMVFSFRHFCKDQGTTFKDWDDKGKLHEALNRLEQYSNKLVNQTDKIYTIYKQFPQNSGFIHPKHVPEDACWARIHVNGKLIIAGHIVGNVFYVVFFDSDHRFYITKTALEH